MRSASTTIIILLKWFLLLLLISTAGRSLLLIYYSSRLVDVDTAWWLSLLNGLRMDCIVASYLLLPAALVMHLAPALLSAIADNLLRAYFMVVTVIVLFIENATLPFIDEYDVRPNQIFINYLEYPREVMSTVWALYKPQLALAFILIVAMVLLLKRRGWYRFDAVFQVPLWKRILVLLPVLVVLVVGGRASFGHRPANPSDAVISNNRLFNEITRNSVHNLMYAVYSASRHDGDAKRYGKMDEDEAYRRVGARLGIPIADEVPFRRHVASHISSDAPKNLVIIIEESLGAQFVGSLGDDRHITPHIDSLSDQSLFFTRLYSTGTRSVRGLSGLVSGVLPVPGKGVIKRNLSQYGFFTVASLLKQQGYASSFIYGGESRFDNMKSWFSGNGFDLILDDDTFPEDVFHGSWGVDDDYVLERADALYRSYHEKNQNFVSVVFSTTNHQPFDYPEGVIEPVDGVEAKSVENAIKYADHAIGHFVEMARQGGYFEDTVIVIAADHNIRTYGDEIIPVNMFHIPGLILGGGVEAERIDKLVSQPDILATAIDLLGVDVDYPILGNSIYRKDKPDVALMQYHDIYGLRAADKLAVIQPGVAASTYNILAGDKLVATDHDEELEKDALAFVVTLDALYRNRLHK